MSKVCDTSAAVEGLRLDWALIEPLMGGTRAMRHVGEKLLPKWPNEGAPAWDARRDTATLFPAYERTVSVMASKPFSKPVTLGEDVPDEIVAWCEDVDREGVNLHAFAAEMFEEGFYGLAGILVDSPKPPDLQRPMSMADQKAAGMRPYFVRVKHGQFRGWFVEIEDGKRVLAMLRICETVEERSGEFGSKAIEQIRVLVPGQWAVYRKGDKNDEWEVHDHGVTGLPYIPFVPVYGKRKGFMDGRPPLLNLAYLNVKHWQSQSDQDTILHVARVPILALSGGDEKTTLTVGASSAVALPLGAKLEFVEHSGLAIEAGAKSLDDLEQQMIQAGAELLVKQSGQRTATESASDAEANKCDLQRMAEGFEDALDQALQIMADYAKLGSGGHVTLYKDFGASTLTEASGQLLLSMEEAGWISRETGIKEMQRRGVLDGGISADDEAAKIKAQPPKVSVPAPVAPVAA